MTKNTQLGLDITCGAGNFDPTPYKSFIRRTLQAQREEIAKLIQEKRPHNCTDLDCRSKTCSGNKHYNAVLTDVLHILDLLHPLPTTKEEK